VRGFFRLAAAGPHDEIDAPSVAMLMPSVSAFFDSC
jgi:hypothetical protein